MMTCLYLGQSSRSEDLR